MDDKGREGWYQVVMPLLYASEPVLRSTTVIETISFAIYRQIFPILPLARPNNATKQGNADCTGSVVQQLFIVITMHDTLSFVCDMEKGDS